MFQQCVFTMVLCKDGAFYQIHAVGRANHVFAQSHQSASDRVVELVERSVDEVYVSFPHCIIQALSVVF